MLWISVKKYIESKLGKVISKGEIRLLNQTFKKHLIDDKPNSDPFQTKISNWSKHFEQLTYCAKCQN